MLRDLQREAPHIPSTSSLLTSPPSPPSSKISSIMYPVCFGVMAQAKEAGSWEEALGGMERGLRKKQRWRTLLVLAMFGHLEDHHPHTQVVQDRTTDRHAAQHNIPKCIAGLPRATSPQAFSLEARNKPPQCGASHLRGVIYPSGRAYEASPSKHRSHLRGVTVTPSYVAFTDSECLVGDAAKNQVAMNPHNTVFDAKRLIGRKFSEPEVQADMKHFPFKIINKAGKPYI
ncbi:Hsp70 protein-domain-containing protein [Schizophyllum commune]